MKNVLIFGGTGFIGLSLANHLKAHAYNPILIARNKPSNCTFEFVQWDAQTLGSWVDKIENSEAIINLVGKSVDCIKTPDNCDLILRSRVDSTNLIGLALQQVKIKPKVWVQMSTAHIYGDPPTQICTESSATGYGLAPFVGKAWEEAYHSACPNDVRKVILRTSFVVGKNGGALESLRRIVSLGLGGKTGHGQQGMSWIHEFDMNEIIRQSIEKERYQGIYIATAPNPLSNNDFMRLLRRKMKMPIGLPAPEFMVRIGAKYIFKTDPELALYGRYLKSERLKKEGFTFKFPNLEDALDDLI